MSARGQLFATLAKLVTSMLSVCTHDRAIKRADKNCGLCPFLGRVCVYLSVCGADVDDDDDKTLISCYSLAVPLDFSSISEYMLGLRQY
ncbi:hypothetical protein F5Y15DRAFT_380828 [Xylariaceae sp. FL0016]|nr:hypothetical protein F5Y15DRAFT_380828 [Xylariaceae sp. FL0016]